MVEFNKLHNCKCENLIEEMPDESVDLIVTSPPYNVDLGNNKHNDQGYNDYWDCKPHEDYVNWLSDIFHWCKRILKSGGRLCINIGDGKNGRIPTHVDLENNLQLMSYLPFTHIIWDKKSTSNRCAWGSWLSPSCPSFPRPFEHIIVYAKDSLKLQTKGETDLEKQEFIDWSYGIWEFSGDSNSDHPAPFPEELPKRLIKMLTWKDAVVFDPFAGSGTTLIAAEKLGRDYIGAEIDEEYCKMYQERRSCL